MLLANHILLILCIFIKLNVWYSWSLKILAIKRWFPLNFAKMLQGRYFVVGGPKNHKLLATISFDSGLQNIVLTSLLLFSCPCYQADLGDIQWNEVAILTARNFNNNWPLYLNLSNMINLCPNILFIKISKCLQFLFWKRSRKKRHKFFILLKDRYFVMGGPINMNVGVFWETSVGFLKSVVLQLFPKYSQSNVNLNVKSRAKFNCL